MTRIRRHDRPHAFGRQVRTCATSPDCWCWSVAGKMGSALLEGWLRLGLDPKRVAVWSRSRHRPSPRSRNAVCGLIPIQRPWPMSRRHSRDQAAARGRDPAGAGAAGFGRHRRRLDHGRADAAISRRRDVAPLRAGARHAQHAGSDRPRHYGGGGAHATATQRDLANACWPQPEPWSGSMTKR